MVVTCSVWAVFHVPQGIFLSALFMLKHWMVTVSCVGAVSTDVSWFSDTPAGALMPYLLYIQLPSLKIPVISRCVLRHPDVSSFNFVLILSQSVGQLRWWQISSFLHCHSPLICFMVTGKLNVIEWIDLMFIVLAFFVFFMLLSVSVKLPVLFFSPCQHC